MTGHTSAKADSAVSDLAANSDSALGSIRRRELIDSHNVDFPAFRKTLRPNFVEIWIDIGVGLIVLALLPILFGYFEHRHRIAAAVLIIPFAATIGYVLAYINLFFHEAAHYNIASTRSTNDFLANLFIGILMGQDIRQYRVIHFQHHRYLGTTKDTERSYFDALSPSFVLESLTGIRVLRVVLLRQRLSQTAAADSPGKSMMNAQLLLGLLLHGSIVALALDSHCWFTAASWIFGVGLVYPFLNALRNLLEHRSDHARADVDYASHDQGGYNRLFGDGLFAATFGGAGFNRHLLHHWEPQISYTCFKKLERYLFDTKAAAVLHRHQTTYWETFRTLLVAGRHVSE